MESQDPLLANLHKGQPRKVPNVRRQGRREPRVENRDEYEAGSDISECRVRKNGG